MTIRYPWAREVPQGRVGTAIDAIAERYVDTMAALDPVSATFMGLSGHDHEMTEGARKL